MLEFFNQAPGLITASATMTALLLTWWRELWRASRARVREKNNFIRALFAEIDFNTRDLNKFQLNSATISYIEKVMMADGKLRPHVTDAHHTMVYKSNISKIHFLDDQISARLVLFYGLLDKIKSQIDGINLPSFDTISVQGKTTTLKGILANVQECEEVGENLLGRFAQAYPDLALTRHARRFPVTKQSED